jgi:hypothetical protein
MIHWLVSLPPILGGLLSAGAAVVFGLATYAGARAAIGKHADHESSNQVIQMFRVVATLLSLLLSLTFADLRTESGAIRSAVTAETALLADIYRDLSMFDSQEAEALQTQLMEYVDAVIVQEWEALGRGEVDESVIARFQDLELSILRLEAVTPLQAELRSRLVEDIDSVSDSRTTRLVEVGTEIPTFLPLAILGFLWTSALLSVCATQGRKVVFIGAYCAFFGIVIYIILAMDNHFEGIGEVTPSAFELLSDYAKRI